MSTTAEGIVCGMHYLKLAFTFFEDWKREFPNSRGANLFEQYNKRINWILDDMLTNPMFDQAFRDRLKTDLNKDILILPAIAEKMSRLECSEREEIERAIDDILQPEPVK